VLHDGKNQYELAGMSAGERAIFPILMDFARWNINNSIIIIDEIELHLHPPLQQALIRSLPHWGQNNQFIITSHSNSVASMFDENENQIIRLSNE
jgi:predicted ATP-binding protein involved in virulence